VHVNVPQSARFAQPGLGESNPYKALSSESTKVMNLKLAIGWKSEWTKFVPMALYVAPQ
jgi:hypothetical protein